MHIKHIANISIGHLQTHFKICTYKKDNTAKLVAKTLQAVNSLSLLYVNLTFQSKIKTTFTHWYA